VTTRVLSLNPVEQEEQEMCARYSLTAVAVLLLSSSPLLAGGLPRLCLPVDGVTTDNAKDCAKLLADALGKQTEQFEVFQNDKQWYATFRFNREPVTLSELDAALKGSPFSIPRDKLHLFGHVTLEVDIAEASTQKLLTDLKAMKLVTVEKSKRDKGVLYVTVVMPYSNHFGGRIEEFGKVSFAKERFGAEPNDFGPRADPPATPRDLPSYAALRAVAEKHKGTLNGIRWECWGCRALGGVAVADASGKGK
jgi:hypothetical protein